jgi:hypothetical protein
MGSLLILWSLSIALVFGKKTEFIDTRLMALVGTPSSRTKGGFVGSVEPSSSSYVASKQYSETVVALIAFIEMVITTA